MTGPRLVASRAADGAGQATGAIAARAGGEAPAPPVDAGADDPAAGHSPTLRSQLVRTLRQQVLDGRYKPGERLNESAIAREFRVSRIPIREALSQLQEQGLVMNRERRGMFVMRLSDEEVQQINSLRLVLEAEAMRLARARLDAPVRRELTALLKRMDGWSGPLVEAAALDRQFHAVVWRASGNPYLERTLGSLTSTLFVHKALEHVSQEIRRWRLSHHRELLDYVAGGPGDPQLLMLAHLRMGYNDPERYSSLALETDNGGTDGVPEPQHGKEAS